MKNNLFIKVVCLIIAALMIMPALPDNQAYAASIASNNFATINSQNNTALLLGSYYMKVQVFVDGSPVYESESLRFGSRGPGTVTVNANPGYELINLYRSDPGVTTGGSVFTNGSNFVISSGSNNSRTLRIYLESVPPETIIDNEYVSVESQTDTVTGGNTYMRVQIFVDGGSTAVYDSGSSTSSMFRFGSSGPGTITVTEKSGYELSNLYRSSSGRTSGGSPFTNGTVFSIDAGTGNYRTLRIYINTIPQAILDNEYVSVVSQNNTNSSGNYYMRVQIFVDNTNVYDTGGSSGRFRFSNGPGTITVTEKSGYGLSDLYRSSGGSADGGSQFTNGTVFSISSGSGSYRTLRIYLNSAPQTIVDNDYVNIVTQNAATISGNNDDSAYMRVQVFVEGVGSAVYDSGSSSSSMFRFGESGPGTVSINEKSGYEITNIYRSNPNSTSGNNVFNNGTNFQIGAGTGSYRTLRIYLRSIPQTILDNEYVSVVSQNNTNSSGNYYMRVQIFVDNTNVYDTGSSGRFRFSNGPGTITVTEKSGYELLNLYRSSSGSTSGGSLFTNGANFDIGSGSSSYRTLRIYLTSLPQTIVDNEYVTVVSRNRTTDSGSDDSSKFMRVQVYLDDENIPVYDSGSSSSSMFRYGGSGPGAVTVTENSGYRILYLRRSNENTTNGNNAFNNGSDFSISTRPNRYRTLKIYLESLAPKALKINYFYDNVLQPEESTTSIIPIGEQVNLELKNIEGKVFQKARISDDNIERSIDVETKEISFTMPNKEVTLDYYYGTEGQVLLKKTAEPIPGKTNEFYIDLSVEGTPIVTRKAADIVLVFDKSGSMAWGVGGQYSSGPSRMSILKEAANIFINRVIPANEISLNQVSIVTYSGNKNDGAWNDAEILQPFTSINTIAKNSYADLDAVGGTNSQAGFVTAQEAFDESNGARQGVERYVIYMTDGAAGYYYNSSNGNTEGTDSPSESNPNSTAVSRAISSAIDLKNATNAKIYTVAFISNDSGAVQVLNPKDSRGNNRYQEGYYKATSATELTGIYNLLAEKISEEIANNAVITDTLPSDFTFDTTSLPADVTIDTNGKLTWNLGTVNTDEEKIRVAVKYSGDKYGISFTNESCGIEYVHKNTPDEVTTKTFEVPLGVLSPVIELPTQSVPFGYSLVIDPIPSAYDSNKLNAGEDKGYRVSDLSVSIYKHPDHGTVVLNDDGTFLYTPDEGYEGDDSFQYKVIMEITNDYGIDPDGLVGDYVTITTVYINVEKRPTYTLTIHYVQEGIGEMLDLRYSAELAPGQSYSVTSPEVTGWTAQSKTVTGTMPMGDVHVWVTYTRNESKLLQHRMYPNKGLNYELMGAAKEDYKIVSGIDYTFGFEFVAGEDNPNFSLSRSNTVNNTLDTFKLYDESGNLLDSRNTLEGLNGTLIEQGKTYTITYRLRFENNVSGSTSLEVDFEYMDDIPSGVYKELNITSTPMYQLQ